MVRYGFSEALVVIIILDNTDLRCQAANLNRRHWSATGMRGRVKLRGTMTLPGKSRVRFDSLVFAVGYEIASLCGGYRVWLGLGAWPGFACTMAPGSARGTCLCWQPTACIRYDAYSS